MITRINSVKSYLLLLVFGLTIVGFSNKTNDDSAKDAATLSIEKKDKLHFNASLKGSNEVPANDSNATGEAIVSINKEETMIHFKLITANIENVTASHFHMAPAGSNGGVVVGLYSNPNQPSGPANGILAEGYITADDIGESGLSDLIDAMRAGNIYVNVHTTSHLGGEIRGQL
ncbi:CHRD domain-containing protein [Snuella sedimenti]|uniref:CHRD domain-containing protein n=1 Tax=Snuella sedimenti TaxID=2798802 RepID=A0A8J7IGM2_9FLAO|nr:CHRD domain-containing protein [Snuella sedimenti]MBJ6367773.1 CHRD domain-containing protein [Snuella sedimenti]